MEEVTVDISTEAGTANMTEAMPTKNPALYTAYQAVMMCTTGWIMFALGSGTKLEIIKERLKRPVGPVIGLLCQCFVFPALMYGYAHGLAIDENISVGMIIAAATPGGAVSNMFTFWSGGDLDLSVTMTSISTFLAIGFMPMNMYIYVRAWLSVSEIPFVDMVVTILVVWGAVILGHVIGRIFPKTVPYLTKVGSVLGFILILVAGAVQGALFPEVWDLHWTVWFAAFTMPLFAYLLGFFGAYMFCLDLPQRTAIAFEVSLQNIALAITIVSVAFPNAEVASYYSQYIILYGTFQIVIGVTLTILHREYFRMRTKTTLCHQIARWRQRKEEQQKPDLHTVTTNGTTMQKDQGADIPKSDSFLKMPYKGSSLSLTHMDSDKTGSGFVPDCQVGSNTQLVRLDSVNSEVAFFPNGSVPSTPVPTDGTSANGYTTFTTNGTTGFDSQGIDIFIEDKADDKADNTKY